MKDGSICLVCQCLVSCMRDKQSYQITVEMVDKHERVMCIQYRECNAIKSQN